MNRPPHALAGWRAPIHYRRRKRHVDNGREELDLLLRWRRGHGRISAHLELNGRSHGRRHQPEHGECATQLSVSRGESPLKSPHRSDPWSEGERPSRPRWANAVVTVVWKEWKTAPQACVVVGRRGWQDLGSVQDLNYCLKGFRSRTPVFEKSL